MKIVISAYGTTGDVHPVVLWAKEAFERKHDILLVVSKGMEFLPKKHNLPYKVYSGESAQKQFGSLGGGKSVTFTVLNRMREHMLIQAKELPQYCKTADLLVGSSLDPAAKSVAEKCNIPFIRMVLTPIFGGENRSSLFPYQSLPKWMNKIIWKTTIGLGEILAKAQLNKARKSLGLFAVKNYYDYTITSPSLICLDKRLAPPAPQWPKNIIYTGYPFSKEKEGLKEDLLEFINAGEKPIYLGFGSMGSADPSKTTQMIIDAIKTTKTRVIIQSGWANLGGENLPDYIFEIGPVNHGELLAHTSGAIHHGGAGTTHTVAFAGIPQLIIPHITDQFYYAQSVKQNELGPKYIPFRQLNVKKLSKGIMNLKSKKYADNAMEFKKEMEQNSESLVVDELERFVMK